MRFVRTLGGLLLLIIGLPTLLAGSVLWTVNRHADAGGDFTARFETVRTSGHAVVVDDLDALLRREAPFARMGDVRLRLEARTPDGPAFVGLAPTDEVRRWLASVPHAGVRRVPLSRGPLLVRLDDAAARLATDAPAAGVTPLDRPFWVREGVGSLEWTPEDLTGRPLSLVVMRPDGRADLALDLRAELRAGWIAPATWALLAGGVLLVTFAVLLLFRPVRPREVVFVVEPDQVPVLAGRLGVTSLSGLGDRPTGPDEAAVPAPRQLTAVGSGPAERSRVAIGTVPARRPASLADLVERPPAGRGAGVPVGGAGAPGASAGDFRASGGGVDAAPGGPPELNLTLAWPPVAAADTPVPAEIRSGSAGAGDARPAGGDGRTAADGLADRADGPDCD
ncbi:hypothetical protein ACFOOK_27945 [Micromonospora krabiensis]|uniref:Uncharacterized protein n=1 Tax=Micromonospora krabiensis TaxID=307121 RepID=A0A1C3N4U9_9ACTN|nr:hypothetical protein GA0070620_3123 [Micromonospora krabiensis]